MTAASYRRGSARLTQQIREEREARRPGYVRDREAIIHNQREEIAALRAEIERLNGQLVEASETIETQSGQIADLESAVELREIRAKRQAGLASDSRRRERETAKRNKELKAVIRLGMTPERYTDLLEIVEEIN